MINILRIFFAATVLLLLLGSFGCQRNQRKVSRNQVCPQPFAAPDFQVRDFTSGKLIRLSNLRGKPVVINFWFAGCPPCRWEAPAFKTFSEKNPDITVLDITDPKTNEPGAVAEFIKTFGWHFPVALDEERIAVSGDPDGMGKITAAFDPAMLYPTTFPINREDHVVGKIVNYVDWETAEMRDVVGHLRNGKLIWYYRYLSRRK